MNRMPFFAHASGFDIKDSHMSEVGGDYFNIHFAMPAKPTERIATQLLGKRKKRDLGKGDAEADRPRKRFREVRDETSEGLKIVHREDIDFHRQLTSGSNYCTHSAFYGGRIVVVKVFHGPYAKQSWKLNLTLVKNFLHSNVPKMVGISGEKRSESPFIIFHGISDRKMNSLLAKALRTDLNKSVQLSMKTVKGIAAALSYLETQNLLWKGIVNDLKWENFDIFGNGSDEPVLSIHLPDTTAHGPHPTPSFYHLQDHRSGFEILSRLCQKLFSEVNSILYDDSPERELDTDDSVENYSRVIQTDREGHSNVAGDVSSSTEVPTSHETLRREVRWKLDKNASNRSLESIARRFEDYLDRDSADSPLRRITASPHNLVSHRCPGYLREEIILTADVSRCVVVAHRYPRQNEICTICGQLVQYPSNPVPPDAFLDTVVDANSAVTIKPIVESPTALKAPEFPSIEPLGDITNGNTSSLTVNRDNSDSASIISSKGLKKRLWKRSTTRKPMGLASAIAASGLAMANSSMSYVPTALKAPELTSIRPMGDITNGNTSSLTANRDNSDSASIIFSKGLKKRLWKRSTTKKPTGLASVITASSLAMANPSMNYDR